MSNSRPPWIGTGRAARSTLLVLSALSAACIPKVNGVGLREVQLDLPGTFDQGEAAGASGDTDAIDAALAGRDEIFEDVHLLALIDQALQNNQELEILRQEINVSNAEIIARRGEALPKLGLGVGAGIEKVGRYTSQGAADASTDILPGMEVPEHLGDFRIALNATWEIDIWKKLRNATAAARYRYLSSIDGRNFVVTGLVAEVSGSYYELLALDRQLDVVDTNIEILGEALRVVQLQQDAGRTTELAVQRFDAERLKNQSRRFEILQRIVETENRINLLCGRYPQSVARSADGFIDTTLTPLQPGRPDQLLERRPDVHAAELELEAAKLDVKVARARFYPTLALDAQFGLSAFTPEKLIAMPASLIYNAAANLFAPLLNRAAIKADWYAANARQMQAVVSYEQTVLRAFVDVVNKLALIHNLDLSYDLKAQQVARLQQAIDTSNQLFLTARADYLEVLTTRREALEAEIELIETKQRQLGARIDLYRALGGGWTPAVEAADSAAPGTSGKRSGKRAKRGG